MLRLISKCATRMVFVSVIFCVANCIEEDIETNNVEQSEEYKPTKQEQISSKQTHLGGNFVCPSNGTKTPFFSLPCKKKSDCSVVFGGTFLCCRGRCLQGVLLPVPEPKHKPLLGFIPRICPAEPLAELLEIKNCTTDEECSPRVCCPERPSHGGTGINYCRTPVHRLDKLPTMKQFLSPLQSMIGYFQCTPAPPPLLDLFPKQCRNPLDCFPNLCCQENGRKVCRPPKRSLLALLAGFTQRLGPLSTKFLSQAFA